VFGALVLFRKEFGVVTWTGQVDPGQPQSSEALNTYLAEVTANVPNGIKTTQDDAPWQYTTIHAPDVPDVLGIPATQLRSKIKGAFLRSALDGSQIRTIFERLTSDDYGWRGAMAGCATWGGRINALSPHDTAVAERDSVALFSVGNFWHNPEDDERHLTWNRTLYRDVFAATGGVPVPNDRTGGCYINWPDPDLLDEEWNQSGVPWSELYYGGNYKKLQEALDPGVVVITHAGTSSLSRLTARRCMPTRLSATRDYEQIARDPHLVQQEVAEQQDGGERDDDRRRIQYAVGEQPDADGGRDRSHDVEALAPARGTIRGQVAQRRDAHRRSDGHVDEEDPAPPGSVHQHPAQEEAQRAAEAVGRAPQRERGSSRSGVRAISASVVVATIAAASPAPPALRPGSPCLGQPGGQRGGDEQHQPAEHDRRRPRRSPARPPSSRNPPKVTM